MRNYFFSFKKDLLLSWWDPWNVNVSEFIIDQQYTRSFAFTIRTESIGLEFNVERSSSSKIHHWVEWQNKNVVISPGQMSDTSDLSKAELTSRNGFAFNSRRGTGLCFTTDAFNAFLAKHELSHMIRAHEYQVTGVSVSFLFMDCHSYIFIDFNTLNAREAEDSQWIVKAVKTFSFARLSISVHKANLCTQFCSYFSNLNEFSMSVNSYT